MKVYEAPTDEDPSDAPSGERKVGIAEYEVTTGGAALTTSGLGSCVGVALVDTAADVGGLVHVMLPSADGEDEPAKYADSGVRTLVEEMEAAGADRDRIRAKLAGGSDMLDFSDDGDSIGSRNVAAVRETLGEFDIPVEGEDVGGQHGRSLRFEPGTGDLVVTNASQGSETL